MRKFINFRFSHLFLIAFIASMAAVSPIGLMAQDEMPIEEETIIPPTDNSSNTPPVIIDESDSDAVNDVEEYDG